MRQFPDSWIQTFTGKRFWPLEPRSEDVCIEDIAHALALVNRFGGHTVRPYPVGHHSLLLSVYFELSESVVTSDENRIEFAKYALLHDAAEAYVGDMVRPMKRFESMASYRMIEDGVLLRIFEKFGLNLIPAEVDVADKRILLTERNALMVEGPCWDRALAFTDVGETEPLDVEIANWQWPEVEARFLAQYHCLWEEPL